MEVKTEVTMNFKYTLEKNQKKKHICPSCGKRRFVRYIETETSEYLPEEFGRCDREQSCGYHHKPGGVVVQRNSSGAEGVERTYIPFEILKTTRKHYEQNSFVRYLLTLFDSETVTSLISRYHLGTSLRGCIFWYMDHLGNVSAGQIKQFDESGHTVKDSETWVHSILKDEPWAKRYAQQERKVSCLFGAHLLKLYPQMPIALCEAPKTAVIASAYYPEFIWMAVFNKSSLQPYKTDILKGRPVTLFPDLGAYEHWKQYGDSHNFSTSDILEKVATEEERRMGLDLADFLTRYSVYHFKKTS